MLLSRYSNSDLYESVEDITHCLPFKVIGTCYLKNSRKHYRIPMSITMKTINTSLLILRMNLTNHTYNKNAIRVYMMSSSDYEKLTELTRFVYPLLKDPKLEVTVKQIRFCTTFVVNIFHLTIEISTTGLWEKPCRD